MEMGPDIAMLNAALDQALETALQHVDPSTPNKCMKTTLAEMGIDSTMMQQHDNMLQSMLQKVCPISKRMLPYTNPGQSNGIRMRSRCDTKTLRKLAQLRKALHTAVRSYRASKLHSVQPNADSHEGGANGQAAARVNTQYNVS